jgi:hypothetical protein
LGRKQRKKAAQARDSQLHGLGVVLGIAKVIDRKGGGEMKRVFRQSFYAGVAGFIASTAIWGQQVETEQERRPPAAWKKVNGKKVSLPAGTMLAVRLIDRVSSEKSQAGDRFEGSLDTPVMVGGAVVAD